jgi:hypothetical protein
VVAAAAAVTALVTELVTESATERVIRAMNAVVDLALFGDFTTCGFTDDSFDNAAVFGLLADDVFGYTRQRSRTSKLG